MAAERSVDTTSRGRILAAIVEWDRGASRGSKPGSFVFLLTDAERGMLAATIDRALFGAEPGEWVGPQLTAEVIAKIAAIYSPECARPYAGCLHTRCVIAALLDDRTALESTIRNGNVENCRLRDGRDELAGERQWLRSDRHRRPWRVGTRGLQTIYDASKDGDGGLPGRSLGRMDTPALAAFVVASVNAMEVTRTTDPGGELVTLRDEMRRLLVVEPAEEADVDDALPERLSRRFPVEPAATRDYPAITAALR